jgi:hypothetical protein
MQSAAVADIFSITAGGEGLVCCSVFQSGPSPVSSPIEMFGPRGFANGFVSADEGQVKASLAGSVSARALFTDFFTPIATALDSQFVIFDGPTPTVQTRGNIHIDGSLSVDIFPRVLSPFDPHGLASFTATIQSVRTNLLAFVHIFPGGAPLAGFTTDLNAYWLGPLRL